MLEDIKKTLWATADKLRANMDAAEYKHLVLGLIFIKYISDSFEAHKTSLTQRLRNPDDELFYGDASDEDIAAELEDRDYFTAANVFWVPEGARWATLQAAAPQPDIGKRSDDALTAIEQENPLGHRRQAARQHGRGRIQAPGARPHLHQIHQRQF